MSSSFAFAFQPAPESMLDFLDAPLLPLSPQTELRSSLADDPILRSALQDRVPQARFQLDEVSESMNGLLDALFPPFEAQAGSCSSSGTATHSVIVRSLEQPPTVIDSRHTAIDTSLTDDLLANVDLHETDLQFDFTKPPLWPPNHLACDAAAMRYITTQYPESYGTEKRSQLADHRHNVAIESVSGKPEEIGNQWFNTLLASIPSAQAIESSEPQGTSDDVGIPARTSANKRKLGEFSSPGTMTNANPEPRKKGKHAKSSPTANGELHCRVGTCMASFKSLTACDRHRETHFPDVKRWRCPGCREMYKRPDTLKKHLRHPVTKLRCRIASGREETWGRGMGAFVIEHKKPWEGKLRPWP